MSTWADWEEMEAKQLEHNSKVGANETPEERAKAQQLLKGFLRENEANSSKGISSQPRDLVEDVMQTYGFTREKAEEEIRAFGG